MRKIITERFWEVDFLRGVAILMMVTYHSFFLSNYFGGVGLNLLTGFWHLFQIATATTFIFLVGVSLTLSFSHAEQDKIRNPFPRFLKRGLTIFTLGLLITAGTRVFLGQNFVRFGILHLIGLSIILVYPFLKKWRFALPVGVLFISVGVYFKNFPRLFIRDGCFG